MVKEGVAKSKHRALGRKDNMSCGRTFLRVSCVCLLACAGSPVLAQTRSVNLMPGVGLLDHIKAEDTDVRVIGTMIDPPLFVLPERGVSETDWLSSLARSVIVVRAKAVQGELTPERNWIQSSITAEVTSVVRTDEPISIGATVMLEQNCGSIEVGGKRLTAVIPWLTPIDAGKEYLLFGSLGSAGQPMLYRAYEILPDGHLKALEEIVAKLADQVDGAVHGARLTEVVARIHRMGQSRKD